MVLTLNNLQKIYMPLKKETEPKPIIYEEVVTFSCLDSGIDVELRSKEVKND